jgi:hypothetical protein
MSIITPIGTLLCYGPSLFEPKRNKFDPSKDPRCEGNLIFSKAIQAGDEYKALKKAVFDTAAGEFKPAQMKDPKFLDKIKWCLKPYDRGEEGDMILKAWTKEPPPIVNANNEYVTVKGDVWSGQLGRFEIALKAYENTGSYSVVAFLNSVQITKSKMPRLDGRKPADKVFSRIEEEAGETMSADSPF